MPIAINISQLDTFPIMGKRLSNDNSVKLDFSAKSKSLETVDLSNTAAFNDYVFAEIGSSEFGYGGYLENRIIYKRSDHFQAGDPRCMHLGVDVWCEAFHPIYAPLDGKVHSIKNNDNYGDYGPTIVLEHLVEGNEFYTLYGHLSIRSIEKLKVGQPIQKGESFCELGPFPENGDWPPHIHFQFITDMEGRIGDFPGVCSPAELGHYQRICLDPKPFL